MGQSTSFNMDTSNHTCGSRHTDVRSAPSGIARQFVPANIYGADFDLSSANYDGPGDWKLVPCPMAEHECKECGKQERHKGCIIVAIHALPKEKRQHVGCTMPKAPKPTWANSPRCFYPIRKLICGRASRRWALWRSLRLGSCGIYARWSSRRIRNTL